MRMGRKQRSNALECSAVTDGGNLAAGAFGDCLLDFGTEQPCAQKDHTATPDFGFELAELASTQPFSPWLEPFDLSQRVRTRRQEVGESTTKQRGGDGNADQRQGNQWLWVAVNGAASFRVLLPSSAALARSSTATMVDVLFLQLQPSLSFFRQAAGRFATVVVARRSLGKKIGKMD
nr:hypothetical protein Itr_chr03CG06530 [Ipomoea trifida]